MAAGSRRTEAAERARLTLERRSDLHWAFFGRVFESTLRQGVHALRAAAVPKPSVLAASGLVIFSNHPSWWDPIVLVTLARKLLPGRRVFAPMEARMVQRYGFMPRIGVFGVDLESGSGAADFLATAKAVLERGDVLIVTAQGRFADVRERPLGLAPGLAHLAHAAPGVLFLPVALEYAFWLERRFEVLVRFGDTIEGAPVSALRPRDRLGVLEAGLATTMDALSADAIARDPAAFQVLLGGSGGIHPVFDAWSRLKALASGRRYIAGHGTPPT